MLNFVDRYFPNGFKTTASGKFVPCTHFEAISVGVALALRENNNLVPAVSTEWSDINKEQGKRFKYHTTTHSSNSQARLSGRIEYIKNMLLYGSEKI